MHLEILLQEQLISRKRLAAFAPGKVLPLAPAVIHCVEVRVNGQLLALGEMHLYWRTLDVMSFCPSGLCPWGSF